MTKIAVITVDYKTKPSLIKNLEREIKNLGDSVKFYVINNNKKNLGYAYGINRGLKKGLKEGAEIFLITNPDISLRGLTKDDLLEAGRYLDIWGLAMKQKGKIYFGGEIDKWRMSGGLIDERPKNKIAEVDYVSGSLMFVKRKVVEKIGFFDESYFMYYEDVDYCLRARKAGFKVGIDSVHVYLHFENSDNNKHKKYFLAKNRLRFLLRYGTIKQKFYELARLPKTIWEYLYQLKQDCR